MGEPMPTIIRGDARRLPLPDGSVDLIVTSPPYFGLRSYTDGGEHYDGQIGSEPTPAEFIAALVECTRRSRPSPGKHLARATCSRRCPMLDHREPMLLTHQHDYPTLIDFPPVDDPTDPVGVHRLWTPPRRWPRWAAAAVAVLALGAGIWWAVTPDNPPPVAGAQFAAEPPVPLLPVATTTTTSTTVTATRTTRPVARTTRPAPRPTISTTRPPVTTSTEPPTTTTTGGDG